MESLLNYQQLALGSINIPRSILEFKNSAHPEFQNKQRGRFLVFCFSGGHSALVRDALNKLVYNMTLSMNGGCTAWKESESGLKIITPIRLCLN